ncbi:Rha family transcriptional regulator [Ornithobacterium rhinotracheale]|uniref:Phage regulatory protein Rha (Phage_pRha) n=1 Tax=Ornithobacterium rhinotracheale (strain ATCC 51463 / DSM 15997 / CCUG 23171 / CIP 104009 / LMG 9086) TaxID=867902 RepID=I4A0C0_ORNRL|nr:Rha family transcriptional regulator [Ornithobacterium rhinotracheale]AFL97404.1 Phage regulatory protein Rha (Phage_pRha) [Ornithobacterium rhinotracheale DSM 15997]
MNNLSIKDTMSSREIAQIAGKRHTEVLRSIRNMERGWVKVSGRNFALAEYLDEQGKPRPQYELTKTECLYIATKFNDEARARLVLRWEALETKKQEEPVLIGNDNRKQRMELIELIRANLLRGDVVAVACENGFSRTRCENVMRHRVFHPEIVKALYDKAMERKKLLGIPMSEMIDNLNQ